VNFIISGPSTSVTTVAKAFAGNVLKTGKEVKLVGECLTDSFVVSGNGGGGPPIICGTNIGQHGIKLEKLKLNFEMDFHSIFLKFMWMLLATATNLPFSLPKQPSGQALLPDLGV